MPQRPAPPTTPQEHRRRLAVARRNLIEAERREHLAEQDYEVLRRQVATKQHLLGEARRERAEAEALVRLLEASYPSRDGAGP